MLTLVHGSVLKDELVDELESLRLGCILKLGEQCVVREVELHGAGDALRCPAVLQSAVPVVPIVLLITISLLFKHKQSQSEVLESSSRLRI